MTEIISPLVTGGPDRRAWLRVLAPLALMAAIFYLSSQPAAGDHAWWEVALRKLGHFGGYAILAAAWWWALSGSFRRPLVLAAAIAFLYACSDEWHQGFVDGRHSTPVDVLIDSAGIAFTALLVNRRPEVRRS